MINRRDLVMGAACLAGAGGAQYLRPHREVSLLGKGKIAEIVPATFGDWRSEDMGDPLAINGPGTLSAKLYNQLLVRAYTNGKSGQRLVALMAYGGRQTDELQLHRPEICYPAFGFELTRNEPEDVRLAPNVVVPARRLLAVSDDHTESIIYWSRIGEYLPRDAGEQRKVRFEISVAGEIPDGLLCRFSTTPDLGAAPWATLESFLPELISAVAPAWRKVLIGSERAKALA